MAGSIAAARIRMVLKPVYFTLIMLLVVPMAQIVEVRARFSFRTTMKYLLVIID